jgi:hypothetical protein
LVSWPHSAVGLGLFIASDNNATMSGIAGGLLNLLRVVGTRVGVAAASTALGWGLHAATDAEARTAHAPEAALLSAVGTVLVMLAGFGAVGAAAALVRGKPNRAAGKPQPTPLATLLRRGA